MRFRSAWRRRVSGLMTGRGRWETSREQPDAGEFAAMPQGPDFRFGHEGLPDGVDRCVWVRLQSMTPVAPRIKPMPGRGPLAEAATTNSRMIDRNRETRLDRSS